MRYEEYVQCERFADQGILWFTAPKHFKEVGTGTAPVRLQGPLLLFLLIHHHEKHTVLALIERFIDKINSRLDPLDFKKTETGVTRCHTNTRFAANVLRKYGLLKHTQREAFKTWELSIAGCLAAAKIYHSRIATSEPWTIPSHEKYENFDLQEEIRAAWADLTDYHAFVERLASICRPNVEIFTDFKPTLEKAFALLREYWKIINDSGMTQNERQKISLEYISRLEEHDTNNKFYEDFSNCIQIEALLDRTSSDSQE